MRIPNAQQSCVPGTALNYTPLPFYLLTFVFLEKCAVLMASRGVLGLLGVSWAIFGASMGLLGSVLGGLDASWGVLELLVGVESRYLF